MKQLKFSAHGKVFKVEIGDAFMDNGSTIQFVPKQQLHITVTPNAGEWARLKPQLIPLTYEEFYNRKPSTSSQITMYVYK